MKRWIAGLGVCAFLSAPAIVLAGEKLFFFDEADWETFSTMAEREDVILIQEYRKGLRAWVKNDFETAAKIFLTLAGAGVAEAQYFLAGLYVNGEGVAKDFEEAMLWYERAAITGLPAAQTDLAFGYSLMNKEQASDDYEKGLSWMQKAAQPGNPKAYYGLGRIYDLGLGVPADHEKAVGYYRAAAEMGHVEAQVRIAFAFLEGRGVLRDTKQAFRWYYAAAKQGQPDAQASVAGAFAIGVGVNADIVRSVYWYRRAAKQGIPRAQFVLGLEYFDGTFLPKNLAKSYMWLTLALEREFESAKSRLETVMKSISPGELLEGKARVAKWTPQSERLLAVERRIKLEFHDRPR